MNDLLPELKEDFERWRKLIGDDPYTGPKTVGIFDVLRAHYLIIDYFAKEFNEGVGGVGPKDLNLLHSTLNRQLIAFRGEIRWKTDLEICASLFWGLIKNHAFHDANKRTAFLTLLYHLLKIKRFPDAKQREFELLAVRIASNELYKYKNYDKFKKKPDSEVLFITDFLKTNTRALNKEEYLITYRELDNILNRYDFRLVNPDRNQVDIVHYYEEKVGVLRKETQKKSKRIGGIVFPGWTRQVAISEIKHVRKLTRLTVENGVDSEAFFHGADSLQALISGFQGPLKRLADK